MLLDSLRAVGLTHEGIDVVVLSHLHFDHVGGLLAAWEENAPLRVLFPNATYVVGAQHWQRATHPHPRILHPRCRGIAGAERPAGKSGGRAFACARQGGALSIFAGPHTPGLMLSEIAGPHAREGVVYCADLIPGTPWVHLPVTMGYDRAPETLIDEKHAFLDDKLTRGVRLFFTHDHATAMASPQRDERGRYGVTDRQAHFSGMPL